MLYMEIGAYSLCRGAHKTIRKLYDPQNVGYTLVKREVIKFGKFWALSLNLMSYYSFIAAYSFIAVLAKVFFFCNLVNNGINLSQECTVDSLKSA